MSVPRLAAIAAGLLVHTSLPALAVKPANGLWASNQTGCAAARNSSASNGALEESSEAAGTSVNFISIRGSRINDFEIACTIAKKLKGGAYSLACTGEGERWTQTLTVSSTKRIRFGGTEISGSFVWCRK